MRTAAFTGAGISGDPPASLPRGFGLRNDVLDMMYEEAAKAAPALVSAAQLERLRAGPYKLEVVLGRLWGTIGPDALRCLLALRLHLPNEAHLLAALHLVRGGSHVTLNFDVGVELAYGLLTGHVGLPADVPAEFRAALAAWRRLVPADPAAPAALRVVAGLDAFDRWLSDGRPPALLKIHGSLSEDQDDLVDVVVVDIEELGQLSPPRHAALAALADVDGLVITGYSGADPDVYLPLLAAVPAGRTDWYNLDLPAGVVADAAARGVTVRLGNPEGLATTGLRSLVGLSGQPSWPDIQLPGDGYAQRFRGWVAWVRERHPPEQFAQAWAWLLADLGDLDTAERVLTQLSDRTVHHGLVRLAEVLYSRAKGDDRQRAGAIFQRVRRAPDTDPATRWHCMLRLGDIGRGQAIRHAVGPRVLAGIATAYWQPMLVLLATRGGRRNAEAGGDAYRALQQTTLRILEKVATLAPRPLWPLVALACRATSVLGARAARLAGNGNRKALIRQHRLHLLALATLLTADPGVDRLAVEARSLQATYRNADDLPGAANCAVTLAIIAAARRDLAGADELIAAALDQYRSGRPDGQPIPAGAALVAVTRTLLDRCR